MPKPSSVIGIDLGGTNMQVGVVNEKNELLGRAKDKTLAIEGLNPILDRIVACIEKACRKAEVDPKELAGVGIGAPGAIDPINGIVIEAPNLRWNGVNLGELLARRLGLPVMVENDVNVAAYGEWKLGAGRGVGDLLAIWIGTGIGGGLILNHQLYQGANLTAGEAGHMILFPGNPPGSRSVEHNCSRTAIADRLKRLIRANNPSMLTELTEGNLEEIRAKFIAEAYEKGDELTRRVVDNAAEMLGTAIAGIVTLLSLPRVVLGGGLTEAMGEMLASKVRKVVLAEAFPHRAKNVEVVATALMDNAGLLGAALLARESLARKK
ncbi:MAG: ROK family protein [Phycisphaerae bacterium]|nr:ROK family protein [Phycisphaerae bacterium]